MKKIFLLVAIVVALFALSSCGEEKIEGNPLEKYLEIIDSLECGEVVINTNLSSDKPTIVQFRKAEKGSEILTVIESKTSSYIIYFDGESYYSGIDTVTKQDIGDTSASALKRTLIGAPDYAVDADYFDADKSGIYKTLQGYKFVIVTHEKEDFITDYPDTTLTVYLNKEMIPTKAVIEDEIFEEDGGISIAKTTLKYKSLGIEPDFTAPEIVE